MKRRADKAGSWYESGTDRLRAQVAECVADARARYGAAIAAPGIPVAAVAPHAGLFFSGAVAAAVFERIRERVGTVDSFVVFGACHRARLDAPAIWNEGAWETPLGDIEIDERLAGELLAAGAGRADPAPHMGDNAIELLTPFIRELFPAAKMVPIAMGFFPESGRFGELAAEAAERRGGRVIAVASTDLTHYGASFGVTPAGAGRAAVDWTRANDARFIDAMTGLRTDELVPLAAREHSACGAGAVAAAAGWAGRMGCSAGRLLAYANSHDIMPRDEADHLVGYASVSYDL